MASWAPCTSRCASRCICCPAAWRPSSMPIVEIRSLVKRFHKLAVLHGVDLDVEPGEVVALIGRSGSGKSTLLRCINGLEPIDGGQVRANGIEVTHANLRAVRRSVG